MKLNPSTVPKMEKPDENESLYETHIDLRDFISKKKLYGKNKESNEKSTVSYEELLQSWLLWQLM